MKQYLLSIYQPEGTPEPEVLEPVIKNLDALNEEMRAAGAWVLDAGLHPPRPRPSCVPPARRCS